MQNDRLNLRTCQRHRIRDTRSALARRQFLGSMAATGAGMMAGGLGVFSSPAMAEQLRSDQKRIVVFNMHGGLSQLESWDPEAGNRHRRTVPLDSDIRAGNPHQRTAAADGSADASSVPGARRQHERRRSRQGRVS